MLLCITLADSWHRRHYCHLFNWPFHSQLIDLQCFRSPQEIQSQLTNWKGPDLIGYGELVLEGTFRLQRAKNDRTLFLFDKLLLITKKREETYTYKAHILVSWHTQALGKKTHSITILVTCNPVSVTVLQPNAGGSYSKRTSEFQHLSLQESQTTAHSSGMETMHTNAPFVAKKQNTLWW